MKHADAALQPWQSSEADYPAAAVARERIRFLLRYAVLAASGHNTFGDRPSTSVDAPDSGYISCTLRRPASS
jgi:hypothetical protein